MSRARDERNGGFTLIELLISITILGLIVTAVVGVTITALQALAGRGQTVMDTSGAQLLSSYLVTDVQSSEHVNPLTLPSGDADRFVCAPGALLELRWTDADGTTGTTGIAYTVAAAGSVDPSGALEYQLTRERYEVDVTGKSCTEVDSTIVSRGVSDSSAKTFAVCTPSPCTSASRRVGLQITAFSPGPKSAAYVEYPFVLSGTRRTG